MIKLAVDAMGGDLGSSIVVQAVLNYLKTNNDVEFHVVGKLEELKLLEGKAILYDAKDVMGMEDGALTILRKKETSMNKAVELVANGTCDGIVSCGSTCAFLTLSTLKVKLIPNVKRAALGTLFPTIDPDKFVFMLDLGANNGHFSRIVSHQYLESIIISSDMDYHAVDENYKLIQSDEKYKNIYPVITDLTNPAASIGWANTERDSFIERIKNSDITLALALIHHLTITNNVPFYKIAEFFVSFTKYLIIEWVPQDDSQTMKIIDEKLGDYSYYNIDNFEKAFLKYFSIIEKADIIHTRRTLYLMKRK